MTEMDARYDAPDHIDQPETSINNVKADGGYGAAWYAVFVLTLALMMNFLDRGIINLMIEPMKQDLQISDTQISLIMGFAFVLFQIIVGLPIARLIDTKSRRLILGASIGCWSVMTAACGFAQTYWQLFAARVGVGLGEAGNGPATYSLLSDFFPKNKLPRAIAVLQLGFASGQGLSLLVGGLIFAWITSQPALSLPGIGELRPWQMTFLIVGLPGLLVALLMSTVREPLRRGLMTDANGRKTQALPIREVFAFLHANGRTYYPLFLAMGLKNILSFGYAGWIPAFYMRTFNWTPAKVGLIQGGIMLLIVPLGLFAGTFLAEYWTKKGHDDAYLRVVILGTWLAVPLSILYPLMPTDWAAAAMVGCFYFFSMMVPAPQNAAIQVITPNQMRGQIMALFLFIFNVIGFGMGPTIIALFTDFVFGDPSQLRYAMATAAAIIGPIAGCIFLAARKSYGQSVVKAKAWT
jgi:MFS family permease